MQWCSPHIPTDISGHVWEAEDVPWGLRASCWLKPASENACFHFDMCSHLFHLSFSIYLFVTLLFSPLSPLCTDMPLFCFHDSILFHSVILNRVFMISLFVLLLLVILTRRRKHSHNTTAQQHDRCLILFTACLGDHPLFHSAVTPSVRGGGAAISGRASSHDTPQYIVGYESQLIPPTHLIWLTQFIRVSRVWRGMQSACQRSPVDQRRVQF